jgi:hypothetical protein
MMVRCFAKDKEMKIYDRNQKSIRSSSGHFEYILKRNSTNKVRYGTVRYGTVRYGTVRYGTVRHSTAQYSTVQRSSAPGTPFKSE